MSAQVEWDKEARAVYVRFMPKDEWPELLYQVDVHGDASLILDVAYYDSSEVLGVEMLGEPVGKDGTDLSAHHWVVASRAWEMCRRLIDENPTDSTGWFTLAAPPDTQEDEK